MSRALAIAVSLLALGCGSRSGLLSLPSGEGGSSAFGGTGGAAGTQGSGGAGGAHASCAFGTVPVVVAAGIARAYAIAVDEVIGFAELLVEQRANVGPKGNTEWAASIARNAQALLGIVNNMLDLTKLESGKFVPVSAPIAVADLVDDLAGLTRALVRGRAIEVESRIEAAEDLVSDPGMLRQILANLLGNAAKFTQTGRITLSVTRAGGRRVFSVRDTGGGIPPEDWERVFERFTQVDQSEVRAHGGTGLGLFIARKLAVALGGDVTLESEVGKGSTFSVSVPEQRHAS